MQIYRTFSSKQFFIVMFFRILYSLTEKWTFIIDFFKFYNTVTFLILV